MIFLKKKKNPDNGLKKPAPINLQSFIELFQCTDNLCHIWSFSGIILHTLADEVLQYLVCHLSDLTFTVLIIWECLNAHFTEENTETVDINLKSRTRKDNEIRSLFSQALCRLRRPSTLCRLCRPSTLCRFCRLSTLCLFCRLSTLCRLCRPSTLCRLCRMNILCRLCRLSTLCRLYRQSTLCRLCRPSTLCRLCRPSTLCRLCRPSTLCRLCRLSTLCRLCRLSTLPLV